MATLLIALVALLAPASQPTSLPASASETMRQAFSGLQQQVADLKKQVKELQKMNGDLALANGELKQKLEVAEQSKPRAVRQALADHQIVVGMSLSDAEDVARVRHVHFESASRQDTGGTYTTWETNQLANDFANRVVFKDGFVIEVQK